MRLDDQAAVVLWEGLPLVGEQLPKAAERMAHDTAEYIVKVLPRVEVARLAGLDEAEKKCRGPCTAVAACKKPVLPTQAERPDGVFRCVVVGLEPAVAEIAAQGFSLVEGVINGLSQGLRGDRGALEFLKPSKDGVNDRRGVELPGLAALNRIKISAFFLNQIKLCDAGDYLRRLLGTGGCRLIELPAGMHPAGHLDDAVLAEQFIIAAIGIRVDIAPVAGQETQRPLFAPVQGKIESDQRRVWPSAYIHPQPRFLDLPVSLDLERDDGIVGEQDIRFEHRRFEHVLKDRIAS